MLFSDEAGTTVIPEPVTIPALAGEYVDPGKTGKYILAKDGTATYVAPVKAKGTVEIPDTLSVSGLELKVVAIANGAFKGDEKLKKLYIGKYVRSIGKEAFASCPALTTVEGGWRVTSIGNSAFAGCGKLKSLPAFEKLETIGRQAFKGDGALSALTLSGRVSQIGTCAFNGCSGLKDIVIKTKSLTAETVGDRAFKGIAADAVIQCPKSVLKAYQELLITKGVPDTAKITK